jgi:hypothetical protein
VSRYDKFRRRIAPVALLAGIALLARDSCLAAERIHTTVELELGAARPRIRAVDVEIVVGGETLATYRRVALPGAIIDPCRFPMVVPAPDGELRIDVDLGATRQRLTRAFHAVEGGAIVVTIPDAELR